MTLRTLFESGIINSNTVITVDDQDYDEVSTGHYTDDEILLYCRHMIESFVWHNDNTVDVTIHLDKTHMVWSVELQANSYNDDTFNSEEFSDCVKYCQEHGFEIDGIEARLAYIELDQDGGVLDVHDISYKEDGKWISMMP